MNSSEPVGTIEALWRFPVKSMLGEELEAVDLIEGGVVGDRAYAIRDRETGKVASAKHPKLWPNLLECRAAFVEARLGAAFFNERGLPSAVPEGSFFDLYPFSVLTTSSLDQLGELEPDSRFDSRRFRMNMIVDTPGRGFVENEWLGRTLAIGDDVQLGVALPDPRCVMPSLAQKDLPRDPRILKTLAQHNRIDVAGALYPCAGVYAVAEAKGTIHRDDRVSLV